jgi:hypothetical protein
LGFFLDGMCGRFFAIGCPSSGLRLLTIGGDHGLVEAVEDWNQSTEPNIAIPL